MNVKQLLCEIQYIYIYIHLGLIKMHGSWINTFFTFKQAYLEKNRLKVWQVTVVDFVITFKPSSNYMIFFLSATTVTVSDHAIMNVVNKKHVILHIAT